MEPLSVYIKAVGAGAKRARPLTREEACAAMELLVTSAAPVQVGAFLLALRMKGETAPELAGFVDALVGHTRTPSSETRSAGWPEGTLEVDAHGDGHEGVVSLLPAAACAAAACGVPVWLAVDRGSPYARHGLDGGLGAVGLGGVLPPERAAADIARAGIGACELALGCPPLARLIELRPLLGVRTVAQTLAKLVSSSGARRRVVGAFHAPYVAPLAEALSLIPHVERGLVVQALGGLPEVRPGKTLRVADAGRDAPRMLDFRGLGEAWAGSGAAEVPPGETERAAALANRAALDGDAGWAPQAAATAGLLVHAATGEDVIAAARRALVALTTGAARSLADRLG